MKTIFKITVFALAINFCGSLTAQENMEIDNNLGHYYDSELFNWSYSMFGGVSLNYLNQSSSTIYGIHTSMRNALLSYSDSGQEYKSYKWKNLTGNILMWGGVVMAISAFIPLYTDTNDNNISELNRNISLSLSFGGLVTTFTGIFFNASGQKNIFNAVTMFNRQKIMEYKQ